MAVKMYDQAFVRSISSKVYIDQLGEEDAKRVLQDPKRGQAWIERNAQIYDALTRSYLKALGVEPTVEKKS